MTVATNSARFGRVRRTSQTLPSPHLCCVTEGGLQDLGSLAGYGDAARMGRAFSVDDPGLVRRLTDAGICCALFACSYPFSSCGVCVSVMQDASWQQNQDWALMWANASPQEKAAFEERVRLVEVAMSDRQPPPHERVRCSCSGLCALGALTRCSCSGLWPYHVSPSRLHPTAVGLLVERASVPPPKGPTPLDSKGTSPSQARHPEKKWDNQAHTKND